MRSESIRKQESGWEPLIRGTRERQWDIEAAVVFR